jgi:hypothetical protein
MAGLAVVDRVIHCVLFLSMYIFLSFKHEKQQVSRR